MIYSFLYGSPATSDVRAFFECWKVRLYLGRIIRFGGDFVIGPLQFFSVLGLGTGRQSLKRTRVDINEYNAVNPAAVAAQGEHRAGGAAGAAA